MSRRALLIGVDWYDNFSSLGGCSNDVDSLAPLFKCHEDGGTNFACETYHDPGLDELKGHVRALLAPGADIALLYFAGHGWGEEGDVSLYRGTVRARRRA